MARKWQKLAATERKRITLPQTIGIAGNSSCSTSLVAEKGHFAVYSSSAMSNSFLNNDIIRKLLDMAEEEFGLQSNGHLTLPCDAELMEYAIGLIKQKVTRDVENAFLMSISCSSLSLCLQDHVGHQLPICSF